MKAELQRAVRNCSERGLCTERACRDRPEAELDLDMLMAPSRVTSTHLNDVIKERLSGCTCEAIRGNSTANRCCCCLNVRKFLFSGSHT